MNKLICFILAVFLSGCTYTVHAPDATQMPPSDPPAEAAVSVSPPPETEGMEDLREEAERFIDLRSGEYGVYVKNLKTNEYFEINEHPMFSASIIKLFIMSAVYDKINNGELEYTPEIKDTVRIMIEESDNDAANELVTILGNGDIDAGFEIENKISADMGFVNTKQQTDLQDVRTHPAKGRNYASPADSGRLLEMIYNKQFYSESISNDAMEFLKNQQSVYKIPAGLPEGVAAANKTGEMTGVENDAAIVFTDNCDYILCIMGNDIGDEGYGVDTIVRLSEMVYEYMSSYAVPTPEPTPVPAYMNLNKNGF